VAADAVKTGRAACAELKKHANLIADQRIAGPAREWRCDILSPKDQPKGYFVIGLRGVCYDPDGCGSTLLGWYAVRRSDGSISEWDVGEDQLGKPLTSR